MRATCWCSPGQWVWTKQGKQAESCRFAGAEVGPFRTQCLCCTGANVLLCHSVRLLMPTSVLQRQGQSLTH